MSGKDTRILIRQSPAAAVHEAFERFGRNAHDSMIGMQRNFEKPLQELTSNFAGFVQHMQQQLLQNLQPVPSAQAAFAVST